MPCGASIKRGCLLDPDGNNIEAVHHGPAERSAESIVIRAPVP